MIEDGAQSFGSEQNGRRSCGLSTIGTTSFFPSKPFGGYGDGGACFTNDHELADSMRRLSRHGQTKRYFHTDIGVNGRIDTLQAAILLGKWPNFAQEVDARGRIGAAYSRKLQTAGISSTPQLAEGNTSVYAQYTVQVDLRAEVQASLKEWGIPTSVHYPTLLSQQPALKIVHSRSSQGCHLPVAQAACERVMSLPMHPWLSDEDQERGGRLPCERLAAHNDCISRMMSISSNVTHQTKLLEKLRSRKALIGIVGLGYVGLPLCLTYAEAGYQVLGLDIDQSKTDAINLGESYIQHIDGQRVAQASQQQRLEATTDFTKASKADALILCVPTPLNRYREPDLSFIRDTMAALLPYVRQGQVLSLESTTYPGTTEEELRPLIEQCGFTVGEDVFLVYSPEREDPGNSNFNTAMIPKVMGGSTASCGEVGVALYEQAIAEVVVMSSTRAAEMTKLLENIHRAVNIGLMNELKPLADRMGIDLYEVIRAAATKPFGFVPYYPGPGLGGHCIPIDPFYLTWKAREYGMHTRFMSWPGRSMQACLATSSKRQ